MSYEYCFYVSRKNPLNMRRIIHECIDVDVLIIVSNSETAHMAVRIQFLARAAAVDCAITLAGQEVSENWGSSSVYYQQYSGQPTEKFRHLSVHGYRWWNIPKSKIKEVSREVANIRSRIFLGHKVKVYQP